MSFLNISMLQSIRFLVADDEHEDDEEDEDEEEEEEEIEEVVAV